MLKLVVRLRESARLMRGQSMTEYALILAAVGVVVFATYQTLGQDITSLVNHVDQSLTAT